MASGHFLQRWVQVRLEPREIIRPPNHYSPMFFDRGAALPRKPQPHWIGRIAPQVPTPVEEIKQPLHTELHRFRTGYQTVGQPWMLLYQRPTLFTEPEVIRQPTVDLLPFRQFVPKTGGQPFWMWPLNARNELPVELIVQPDHTKLHQYRVGYQTVGQAYWMWQPTAKVDLSVEAIVQPDHTRLHQYRVGYQTVGQPWYLWQPQRTTVDYELIPGPKPADLFAYRQITVVFSGPPNLHRLVIDVKTGRIGLLISGTGGGNPKPVVFV